ncbi:MAG: hypothetical protein AB1668_06105 [Nanoarchaeota archaeon]
MMVIEGFRGYVDLLIVFSALLAAIAGIITLGAFFHNKLKDLFDDVNYFIFFFLAVGYSLYALGEVSFYLTSNVFNDVSSMGIADVYWTGGAVLILISFIALAVTLFRRERGSNSLLINAVIGAAIVVIVSYLVFGVTKPNYFFGYFYPLVSSMIVAFSLSVIHFFRHLGAFGKVMALFFLSSAGILLGDIFYTYTIAQGTYTTSLLRDVSNLFYLCGYILSFVAFVTLRLRMHALVFGKDSN